MTNMTAEQAIEILNRRGHNGSAWGLRAWGSGGGSGAGVLSLFELLAIAREYQRQEAADEAKGGEHGDD